MCHNSGESLLFGRVISPYAIESDGSTDSNCSKVEFFAVQCQ